MQKLYKSISILMMSLMLPLVGCVNDDSPCPVKDNDADDGVTIEFTVVTREALRNGTRALVDPNGYDPQIGTAAENYLDLRNTVFMLFDQDKTLIKVFIPEVTSDDEIYAKYSVRAFMSPSEFQTLTDGKTDVTFSIAVVGNYSRLSPQNAAYHVGMKLDDLFNPEKVGTFVMPVSNNSGNVWIPSIYGIPYTDASGATISGMTPAQIPMAGIQTYNVSVAALAGSTVDHPYNLSGNDNSGDINMLRALAKIEIVDRIDAEGTGETTTQPGYGARTWIEKVELVGHTTRGSLFPTLNQWNSSVNPYETQYVNAPSIPKSTSSTYVGQAPANDGLSVTDESVLINFFADAAATEARTDKRRVFSCYLTEYNPEMLLSTDYPMWIRLTCQSPVTEGTQPSEATSAFYRVNVAPYQNGVAGQNMPILRNNIYRYEISGIKTDLELELIVNNWNSENTVWQFTDVPGMTNNGYMDWSSDILQEVEATATLIYNTPLTGYFTFAEPKGGTWTAMLVMGPNTESDAFGFVSADGSSTATSISGLIDGNQASIIIKANYPNATGTTENRSARLLFTVTTPDGRTITANVLGPDYGNNKYFTIIQEPAL